MVKQILGLFRKLATFFTPPNSCAMAQTCSFSAPKKRFATGSLTRVDEFCPESFVERATILTDTRTRDVAGNWFSNKNTEMNRNRKRHQKLLNHPPQVLPLLKVKKNLQEEG